MAKKLFRLFLYSLILLGALFTALHFIIASPKAQQRILSSVSNKLSKELQTQVTIDSVAFIPYGKISLFTIHIPTPENGEFLNLERVDFSIYSLNFLKKKLHPKSLKMKGVQVNLQRAPYSEKWNYDFLKKDKKAKKTNQGWQWSFTRGALEINELSVVFKDSFKGNDIQVQVPNTQFRFHQWDAQSKLIDVSSIRFDKPDVYVGIINDRRNEENILLDPTKHSLQDLIENYKHSLFNPQKWEIDIAQVKLIDAVFQLRYEERPFNKLTFDYRNIDVHDIDIELRSLKLKGDSIETYISLLNGKDRTGLEIKSLNSQLSISPTKVIFDQLKLQTGYSYIEGEYSMSYPNFFAFLDYNNAVYMHADFKNKTKVAWKDLNYFATALDFLNHNITSLEGEMGGYVNHLKGTNILLWDGINTVNTDVEIIGLPETEITTYDFQNIKLQTNAMGMAYYVPNIDFQEYATHLSRIEINGDLKFSEQSLDFEGKANTNQGDLTAHLNLQNPYDTERIKLTEGFFALENMQIGYLLDNKQSLQLTGKLDFIENTNSSNSAYHLNSFWPEILWNEKKLDAVSFNALGNTNSWKGQLRFDNHYGQLKTNVTYAKNHEKHQWNIDQELNNFQAKHLGSVMQNSKVSISGKWMVKILQTASQTEADVQTVYLMNQKTGSFFHPLALAYQSNTEKSSLSVNSKDLDLKLTGKWNWNNIINFPKYIQKDIIESSSSKYFIKDKSTDFNIRLSYEDTDSLLPSFIPELKTQGQYTAQLNFNAQKEELTWNAHAPFLQWQGVSFNDLKSLGNFEDQVLISETTADDVGYNHIEWLKNWKMMGNSSEKGILFSLSSEGGELINSLEMKALLSNYEDNYELKFLPSKFKVKSETWHFPYTHSNYHIRYANNNLTFNNLTFESEKQKFNIETTHGLEESLHRVRFQDLNLNLLNGFIEASNYEIQGNLNGTLVIENQTNKDPLLYFDIVGNDLSVQEHKLSHLKTTGFIDLKKQFIHWNQHKMSHEESELVWDGKFYWTDLAKTNHSLDITMNNIPVAWSHVFLKNVLTDLDGHLSGTLNLKGNFSQPIWNGQITAQNVQFKPMVTGVLYTVPEAKVLVENNLWKIPSLDIQDKNDWIASGSGLIKSETWSKWHLSIQAQSEKIQILDLGVNDQNYYYGDINGKAFFSLEGPFDHLVVRVNASPLSNSKLFIPINDESEIQQYGYIQFRQKTPNVDKRVKSDRIDFYLQTSIDPNLEITLILDEVLKDKITARGNGYIQMSSNAQNPLKMNGTYTIDQGTYDFVFRQLEIINFRKKFIIQSNSVIKWDGDPWNALLDVKGYALVKARLFDLISSEADRMNLSNQEIRDAQTPQPILVNLEMNGFLNNPVFDFSLALEEGRSLGTLAYQKLQRINQDARMLINQVGSLLLLEQFVPNEGISNVNLATGSINNMSEIVSSAASSQITNFANKVLGMEDLVIGVKYKNYNFTDPQDIRTIQHLNRNEAGIQVRKNFLSNRLMVEVGGSYDWGRVESEKYTTDFLGDFRIQYFITEDGKIRLNAFRNSQYDVLYGKTVARQGLGIGYKKSFNNFRFIKKDSIKYETIKSPTMDSLNVLSERSKKSI